MNQNVKVAIKIMVNTQFITYIDTLTLDKVHVQTILFLWVAEQFEPFSRKFEVLIFLDPVQIQYL